MGGEVGFYRQHGNTHTPCIGGQLGILESFLIKTVRGWRHSGPGYPMPCFQAGNRVFGYGGFLENFGRRTVWLGPDARDNCQDHGRDIHKTDAGKHAPG